MSELEQGNLKDMQSMTKEAEINGTSIDKLFEQENSVVNGLESQTSESTPATETIEQQKTKLNELNAQTQGQANGELDPTSELSEKHKALAIKLANKISETDKSGIVEYGAGAQQKLSTFSQNMLTQVSSQQTGEIGTELTGLMMKLDEAKPSDLANRANGNLFMRVFSKVKSDIAGATAKYQSIGTQIDSIAGNLMVAKDGLLKDDKMLEDLYSQNKNYFDELNVYISAGKMKQKELQDKMIPEAQAIADKTGNQMDTQHVQDLVEFEGQLEKRVFDLEIARTISIQQAPQIRLIQNSNVVLAQKIQSSVNTAIPLWKNQVAISLTLLRQKDAVHAQQAVSETTNSLLLKNSEMLKISSVETAKENERAVVDIETLQKTQNDLVETLQETLQIATDGRAQREQSEIELKRMEGELKDSLYKYTKNATRNRKDVTESQTNNTDSWESQIGG